MYKYLCGNNDGELVIMGTAMSNKKTRTDKFGGRFTASVTLHTQLNSMHILALSHGGQEIGESCSESYRHDMPWYPFICLGVTQDVSVSNMIRPLVFTTR